VPNASPYKQHSEIRREFFATASTTKEPKEGQVLYPEPKPPSERTQEGHLFLAAGAAAEKLVYGDHDEDAAEADKRDFDQPNSPAFEKYLKEASEILYSKRRHLKRLRSMLKATVRKVDYDLGRLTDLGMDGSDQRYLMLLSKEELGNAVDRT
jgi:hypothetical protein